MKSKISLTIALFLSIASINPGITAQEKPKTASVPDMDTLSAMAVDARDSGRYDEAARLLSLGKETYPDAPWFPETLGDLYSDKELYELSLKEYLSAASIDPENPDLTYKTATAFGYLNRETESITWLERTLALRSDDKDAIGDLGWMLFKVHRLEEGIKVLKEASARLGKDRSFSMTLGTLYSELYDYDNSRKHYMEAVMDAEADGDKSFAAVCYYNLSILEGRWHAFDRSLEMTDKSLAALDRASGHLARGELFLQRQDFAMTFLDYERAYGLDASPLSKINLADACVQSGRLAEAESWLAEAERHESNAWMLNFGTDSVQYEKDLNEIRKDLYLGMANREKRRPKASFPDAIAAFFKETIFRVRSWYHGQLYRSQSLVTAGSYLRERNRLPALVHYYNAFEKSPSVALKYLSEAESTETVMVVKAKPEYDLERAIMKRDPGGIKRALAELDPDWERDLLARGYASLAEILTSRLRRAEAEDAIVALYGVNPGSFITQGFRLPAVITIDPGIGNGSSIKTAKAVRAALLSSWFTSPVRNEKAYAVTISVSGHDLRVSIKAPSGKEIYADDFPSGADAAGSGGRSMGTIAAATAGTIAQKVFKSK